MAACVDLKSVPNEEKSPNNNNNNNNSKNIDNNNNNNNTDDEFTCVVCAEEYKNPTLLQCMHTFCSGCINKLVQVQQDGTKTMSCPNCRFVTKGSGDGSLQLWPNPIMETKIRWQNITTQREENSFKCGVCEVEVANKLCTSCESLKLCDPCCVYHKRCAKFKDHTTLDIEGVSNDDLMVQHEAKCPQHGRKWELYCETCNVRCCPECVPGHRGHPFLLLSHVIDTKLQTLEESLSEVEAVCQRYEQHLHDLETVNNESLAEERNLSKAEVEVAFAELVGILTLQKRKLIDWLDHSTNALKLAKERSGHVRKMSSFLKDVKSHPKDQLFDIVINLSQWKKDLEDMDQSAPQENGQRSPDTGNDFDVILRKRRITTNELFPGVKSSLSRIADFPLKKDCNDSITKLTGSFTFTESLLSAPTGSITLIVKNIGSQGETKSEPLTIGNFIWSITHDSTSGFKTDAWTIDCQPVQSTNMSWMCHAAVDIVLKNKKGGEDLILISVDNDQEGKFDENNKKMSRKYSEVDPEWHNKAKGYRDGNSMEIHATIKIKSWQKMCSSDISKFGPSPLGYTSSIDSIK